MFDLRFNSLDFYSAAAQTPAKSHAALLNGVIGMFNANRRGGLICQISNALLGRAWRLLNLNAIPAGQVRNRHYAGIRCVNISQICGSMGRTGDFDRYFHPLSDRLRSRWVSVAMARCQDVPLPAVRLVQVRDCYFVEDGHHRLSVACAFGETAIDAEVTVWEVSGRLPWEQREARPKLRPVLSAA